MTVINTSTFIDGWITSGAVIWPVSDTCDILSDRRLVSTIRGRFYTCMVPQNQTPLAYHKFPQPKQGFIGFICLQSDVKEI